MSASYNLGAPIQSPFSLFLRSQFWSSAPKTSKGTNLRGKVAIITGSTRGLGLEASRQLLEMGLEGLVMGVRDVQNGEQVAEILRKTYSGVHVQVWALDLESYTSIQVFADRARNLPKLDIVILNAGTQTLHFSTVEAHHSPSRNTAAAHEKLVQVNYLSTMLLAILLLPSLKAKQRSYSPGRLTIVSSGSCRGASLPHSEEPILPTLDDPSRQWNPVEGYAISKLLGHLFIISLFDYIAEFAENVIVNLVDPGLCKGTDLQSPRGEENVPFYAPVIQGLFFCFKLVLGRTVQDGATTYVDAVVTKGKESQGCLVANWKVEPFAAFVYTPEGKIARDQLWRETIAEFEFAGVQEILDGLKT